MWLASDHTGLSPCRRRWWRAWWAFALVGLSWTSVRAAQPPITFKIPAKPLSAGLVDFAVQARISISLQSLGACGAVVRPLVGTYSIEQGLRRILVGSGCGFRKIDAAAFAIEPTSESRRQAAEPSASPRPTTPLDLSELVVVATLRPTAAEKLAYSVSSISAQTLRQEGVRDTNDLALITPGMTVTNYGMGRDKIFLRGLSDGPLTGLTQSPVGLYLDDARLTFNAPDPDIPLVDISRVEVLRGPQGALYGAGSLGGIVHLVSARPDSSRLSGSASASVGFVDGGGVSNSIDAVLNVPLIPERAAARLVFYHDVEGGYIENPLLNLSNVNEAQRNGGRLTVDLRLSDEISISTGVILHRIKNADTQYAVPSLGTYTRRNYLREPQDNAFDEYHITLNGNFSWATTHGTIAYIRHDIDDRYDATIAPPVKIPPGPAAFDTNEKIHTLLAEGSMLSPGDTGVQWLLGAFYAHTNASDHLALTSLGPPVFLGYEELRNDAMDEGALYGEATVPMGWGMSITAGGRLFASKDVVTSDDTSFLAKTSAPFSGSVSQAGFTPKFVLSKRLSDAVLLYLQAAEGYRGPGINTAAAPTETFSDVSGQQPQRRYQGDDLWTFEGGAKLTALNGHLRLTLAAFETNWRHVQSDQLLPSGIPYTANVGDGRNIGLEVEGAYRSGALRISADMLFNDPELQSVNPAFSTLAQSSLGDIPSQSVGLSAHYSWPLGAHVAFALDGHAAYVGSSTLMLNTAKAQTMGAYGTGRLAASVAGDHWRWILAVDNPSDTAGNTFAFGNPFTIRFRPQSTPLRPRTLTLSVEATF